MNEAIVWVERALKLLPELIGLWKAIDAKDERAELDATLALRRKVSDEQMRESLKP